MKAFILCVLVIGLATAEFAAYHALKANALVRDINTFLATGTEVSTGPSVAKAAFYFSLPLCLLAAVLVPLRKRI